MSRGYWLINYNRSKVRRFTKYRINEDQFNEYFFIDNGKNTEVLGKEPPPPPQNREEAWNTWERLIDQGWRRTNILD